MIEYARDEAAKQLPVMEGAREILQYFYEHGIPIATASSSSVEQIETNLAQSGLRDYFDAVVGGDFVANGKPAPDIFLLAAERIGISPADCYVFFGHYLFCASGRLGQAQEISFHLVRVAVHQG